MAAQTFDAVMLGKASPRAASIHRLKQLAADAADKLVSDLRALQPDEQVKVAEALIAAFSTVLPDSEATTKLRKYRPDQARGEEGTPQGGQWVDEGGGGGSSAGRVGRAVGSAALTAGGWSLRRLQDAASHVSLVPHSKSSVREALSEWWGRFTDSKPGPAGEGHGGTAVDAGTEAFARLFVTVFAGAVMYALAHAFVGAAAGAVGTAVGQALRLLIGGG